MSHRLGVTIEVHRIAIAHSALLTAGKRATCLFARILRRVARIMSAESDRELGASSVSMIRLALMRWNLEGMSSLPVARCLIGVIELVRLIKQELKPVINFFL